MQWVECRNITAKSTTYTQSSESEAWDGMWGLTALQHQALPATVILAEKSKRGFRQSGKQRAERQKNTKNDLQIANSSCDRRLNLAALARYMAKSMANSFRDRDTACRPELLPNRIASRRWLDKFILVRWGHGFSPRTGLGKDKKITPQR